MKADQYRDPLSLIKAAFKGDARQILVNAARVADTANGFTRKVSSHRAYRQLVAADVDADKLMRTCQLVRAPVLTFDVWRDYLKPSGRWSAAVGRPANVLFSLFQLECNCLVDERLDGRRFYAEFAALTQLVFDKTIRAESYHRALMRAYAKLEMTPRNAG